MDINVRRIAWIVCSMLIGTSMSSVSHGDASTTHLQVLPQNLSRADLITLMGHYDQDLGVSCAFCHAQNAQTQQLDYASDENPMKQVARIMIGMVRDINDKYLSQIGDRRYAVPVSCGNCHQGQTYPPAFDLQPHH
jgi:hypothetical protein